MRRLEVDKERFACALKDAAERQPEGIGMLREKLLHATLKKYFLEDGALPEQKVGKYIVDLLGKNGIMEIQTGSCAPLRPKLQALLPLYPILRAERFQGAEKARKPENTVIFCRN